MTLFRFFYERGFFTPDQLIQLKQATLSKIICDNADNISMVPVDAFILQERSEFAQCDELPSVDLTHWRECEGETNLIPLLPRSQYIIIKRLCQSIEECAPVERSRRSALFKTLESTRKYQELSERLIELEKKVRKWQLLTKLIDLSKSAVSDVYALHTCRQIPASSTANAMATAKVGNLKIAYNAHVW